MRQDLLTDEQVEQEIARLLTYLEALYAEKEVAQDENQD